MKTQWKEVEESIADVMTTEEKILAKQEYLTELEKVDWKKMEHKLKAGYEQIDWEKVNANLNQVLTTARLDSLQNNYSQVLAQINKTNSSKTKPCELAIPDVSVQQVNKVKIEIQLQLDQIKKLRTKNSKALIGRSFSSEIKPSLYLLSSSNTGVITNALHSNRCNTNCIDF